MGAQNVYIDETWRRHSSWKKGFRTGLKTLGIASTQFLLLLHLFGVAFEVLVEMMKRDDKPLLKLLFGTVFIHELVERCSWR